MSYELISFDLDGTLVDTAGEIAEAANRALEVQGLRRRAVDEITLLIGQGAHELMRKLLARISQELGQPGGVVPVDALLASFDEQYALTTGSVSRPYPGVGNALQSLRHAGVKLACVTNKEFRHARHLLEFHGLYPLFDMTIGGDSLPCKKPHASVLQHVVGALGCSLTRTAHVGDSSTDVLAARNAGVAAWAVPYGYNAGVAIEESEPERLFDDIPAVCHYVLSLQGGRPA